MTSWRKVLVVLILAIGLVASLASSSEPDGEESGGGDGGAATTAAGPQISGEADQIDDVTLGECTTDPTLNTLTASLTVTNDSSDPSDYIIEVAFESEDGSTQFGTGTATVSALANGQTTSTEAVSFDDAPAEPFTCRLTSVLRTASL